MRCGGRVRAIETMLNELVQLKIVYDSVEHTSLRAHRRVWFFFLICLAQTDVAEKTSRSGACVRFVFYFYNEYCLTRDPMADCILILFALNS